MRATPHLEQGRSQTPAEAQPGLTGPISISLAQRELAFTDALIPQTEPYFVASPALLDFTF